MFRCMQSAGFEPAPPKRLELESSALDHSANNALNRETKKRLSFKTKFNFIFKKIKKEKGQYL